MTKKCSMPLLVLFSLLLATLPVFAGTSAAVFPTAMTFNPQTAGTVRAPLTITVYNIGSVATTVTGITCTVLNSSQRHVPSHDPAGAMGEFLGHLQSHFRQGL